MVRYIERGLLVVGLVACVAAVAATVMRDDPEPLPQQRLASGTDTLAILLLSAACPACQDPSGRSSVKSAIDDIVERRTVDSDFGLVLVGVALDWDTEAGLAMLKLYGRFDELIVGQGWLNSAAIRHVWTDSLGIPEVPQLVVVEREIHVPPSGEAVEVRRLAPVQRIIGLDGISTWLRNW
jgi:hypothetical protein